MAIPTDRTPFSPYARAEAFLLGLVNYEVKPPPMRTDEAGWHLREFGRMLDALGHPESAAPIIHVAGTKGKGSTTRLIVSLLHAQGFRRVGSFISPHIAQFRERICINNRPISKSRFVDALGAVRAVCPIGAAEGFRTTFEVLTAMGLWTWRAEHCDAVVLETGLGGRLDATNVPLARVAAITAIGFDHQRVLGHTLREIAGEKAGIFKSGTGAAVVGPQAAHRRAIVGRVATEQARAAHVPLRIYQASDDPISNIRPEVWGIQFDLEIDGQVLPGLRLHALGSHQLDNLRTALMATRSFLEIVRKPFDPALLARGIAECRFPGRMEIHWDEPPVILDAAHCPLSARAAAKTLREHFPQRPIILVLGVLGDKNHEEILNGLAEAGRIVAVRTYRPPTPRACPSERIAVRAAGHFRNVAACADAAEAIRAAIALVDKYPEAVILVTGTFYGLAPARDTLIDPAAERAAGRGAGQSRE